MPKQYKLKLMVTYVVNADSEDEVLELTKTAGTFEHPMFPYGIGWCDFEEVYSVEEFNNG